ncbi:cobalamin-binding protein [Salinirubellus salinus]|uniref:Cobalamin-binding protein n=1 Tax=Salinirubellus salinus TaxID=1364945 RepID=A0A9E7UA36_9EURY|nr:cobalamin-binding protein [Salinirubellus salinus]UWM53808.1 cobalamin-binding protein [Salinirubellus salinus]
MSDTPRVVTLLPSATELVYALGVEPVATSHECDYPPEAAALPAVNRSNVDPEASPASIDEQVVQAEQAGGVYEIDLAALERADPDIVVSQGICDVCAVDAVLVREAVDELGLDCEVLTTDPHSLEDVFDDVERIGAALGREAAATELLADLRSRVEAVRERAVDLDRPRVAVLDWTDPVMVAGHWVPGLVETAGGAYGLEEPEGRSRPREWSEIREYDPEVLVVAPCGFGLDQTLEHLDTLTEREGWADLTAVREGRAYAMDGHHYVNRPGPRLVETLEYLAGVIHPERFDAPADEAVRSLGRPARHPSDDD